jgi:hypothetical protein
MVNEFKAQYTINVKSPYNQLTSQVFLRMGCRCVI